MFLETFILFVTAYLAIIWFNLEKRNIKFTKNGFPVLRGFPIIGLLFKALKLRTDSKYYCLLRQTKSSSFDLSGSFLCKFHTFICSKGKVELATPKYK